MERSGKARRLGRTVQAFGRLGENQGQLTVTHETASQLTVYTDDMLAVWLSGNALASINVVALRQTRLVLGWVTVCGRVNHFGM